MKKTYVKFSVFSDLHGDIVNDARFKLSSFAAPSPDELGVSLKEPSIFITPTTGSVVIKRK